MLHTQSCALAGAAPLKIGDGILIFACLKRAPVCGAGYIDDRSGIDRGIANQ